MFALYGKPIVEIVKIKIDKHYKAINMKILLLHNHGWRNIVLYNIVVVIIIFCVAIILG